jgi:cell division protein FtsN
MRLPTILQRLYKLWMAFSHVLGRIMSSILLTVLWVIVIGLYAIVLKTMRLFSKKPEADTYWIDVSKDSTDMRYQF